MTFPGTWGILEEFLFLGLIRLHTGRLITLVLVEVSVGKNDAKYEIIQNNLSLALKHFYMNTSKLMFHLKQK